MQDNCIFFIWRENVREALSISVTQENRFKGMNKEV